MNAYGVVIGREIAGGVEIKDVKGFDESEVDISALEELRQQVNRLE